LYPVAVQLLEPYTLLLIASLVICVTVWRSKKWREQAGLVATICLSLLWVLSTPVVEHLALGSLEWWYGTEITAPTPEDTIVVLGGSHIREDAEGNRIRLGETTLTRCTHALKLYRHAGRCQIVVSGGKVDWSEPGLTLGDAMRDYLLECGVAAEDIAVENGSSSTFENAVKTRRLLDRNPHGRVFLVTSATHMWRSEACFRRQGVEVLPAPCGFHAQHLPKRITSLLPSASGIQGVNEAMHEWIGVGWYWLRGRI
jgi:uncharacterized SAM-binding protein YcdF (DUF218 family)